MTLLDDAIISKDMGLSKLQEIVKDREAFSPWGHRVRHNLSTGQQQI